MIGVIWRHDGSILQLRQMMHTNAHRWMDQERVPEIAVLMGSASGSPLPKNLGLAKGIREITVSGNHWGDAMNRALSRLSSCWVCSVSTNRVDPLVFTTALKELKQMIPFNPALTGIRVESKNGSLLYCWNRSRLQGQGGWPSKKDWPFPEAADHFRWSTLPSSEKKVLTLDVHSPRREESPWERQKQMWIDRFLAGLEQGRPLFPSPTGPPLVSFLLSVYNGAQTIPWALTSVLYQTIPDFELIVIDDGSTDGTAEEVRRFNDPRIRWLSRPVNRGKVHCLNEAWQEARGEWLFELDADDWLGPEALDWVVRSSRGLSEKVALLYGDRIYWHEESTGRFTCRHQRKGAPIQSLDQYLDDLAPIGPRIYRREAIRQIGGWPVDDYCNGRLYEDIRVVLKLLETHRIHYAPGFHYHVRLRADSVSHKNVHHFFAWKDWLLRQYSKNGS
ncbi:glycosyltransferase family 2 protein [Desmospora profundinema]|uniref:Glycosyltransferase 2-like domain-containing protein n=1 Tax=Desmospora profundinema TaxID=1571184 RepID=A0ABU1IK23_9BACL|nr:glycosyltransferase family A protein [Desmospora profundinema]MDR6224339.1 hypothetical protein [Desmospora profundinema]